MADDAAMDLTGLTVDLLSAFVSKNSVRADDLAGLIASTHAALAGLNAAPAVAAEATTEEFTAAVTSRKSLADRDHILSMIDGKPYRSLKRHLSSKGLTPDDYRRRYNLPASYPMVAPGYSEERRDVAKRLGLGRKPRVAAAIADAPAPGASEPASPKPARRTADAPSSDAPAKAPRKPRQKVGQADGE
ncbi:MAG: MucR family transcriptional regulator [Janthinobacterium lividum]